MTARRQGRQPKIWGTVVRSGILYKIFHVNSALRGQRQEEHHWFQTVLVYTVNPGQPGLQSETCPRGKIHIGRKKLFLKYSRLYWENYRKLTERENTVHVKKKSYV